MELGPAWSAVDVYYFVCHMADSMWQDPTNFRHVFITKALCYLGQIILTNTTVSSLVNCNCGATISLFSARAQIAQI